MDARLQDPESYTLQSATKLGSRDRSTGEDSDGTLASVALCIEQLRQSSLSFSDKESVLSQLLDLISSQKSAFSAVGSHSQVVPVLVSLLRSGSFGVKTRAAGVLSYLCKENDLRVKVLLGGCIPPLLGLLQSTSTEAQVAAAKMIRAVSQGGANDHVRSKIFSTEGVVPVLWKQLALVLKSESLVGDLLTGALRNLSSSTEGFLQETVQARGVDILIELLRVSRPVAQSNACSLLAYVVTNDAAFCSEILDAGIVTQLLRLLGSGHDLSVRAEAAGVLKSLSAQSGNARKEITSSNGIPSLINSTIAPSKEHMQGEAAQALQENAMCALANISGGLSRVISSLTQSLTMLDSPSSSSSSSSAAQASDTLGALASALMIYDVNAQEVAPSDPLGVERTLIKHLNPKLPFVVKERTIEALASLYGNPILATGIPNSEAKRLLIRLITMCSSEIQVELLRFLPRLCTNEDRLWEAVNGREGVQLLISLLGLSSEQQQESSVALVRVLSEENAESNWAVTAAGGIPPLVQILETGSTKAREDSAAILSNLCTHSEDIRACVESADAAPSLLWLLKNGSSDGKDTAARTLSHLIRKSDSATISQLTNLLTSELPEFKAHVLDALRSMISVAPLKDILYEGSAANEAVGTMVRMLGSARAETQVGSASALSDIFSSRKDVRESSVAIAAMSSLMTLLPVEPQNVVAGLLRCLAAILLSVDSSREINAMGRVVLLPLIRLTGSSNLDVTEQAVCALANLFLDSGITADVSPDDVIFPATKILHEGTTVHGKVLASSAVARFIRARDLNYSLIDCVGRAGTVLALVSFLRSSDGGSASSSEALDALALLSRSEGVGAGIKPAWAVLAEFPDSITPIVSCIVNVLPPLQDKAVDILSKLSWCQPEVLGRAVCRSPGTLISIAERTVSSAEMKVKIGACALLVCALKVDFRGVMSDLTESDSLLRLIRSLVSMVGSPLEKENESIYICRRDRTSEDRNISSVINDVNICLWLLCLLANHDEQTRYAIAEAGAVDALSDKISQYFLRYNQGSGSAEHSCVWIAALLLSILYQNRRIAETVVSDKSIVVLSCMLRSEELDNRYFAAQAVASLVCSCSSDTTVVTVAGSGAATGLISLLGFADDDMRDILELSSEFSLLPHPEQDSLEKLLSVEEIRVGAASKKMVPLLVDLLRPLPDRLSAPYLALRLLIKLADGCSSNKVAMVESGAVEALTRYLSLSPQETMEEAVTHLLAILFSSPEIRQHESSFPAVRQLVAVLRLGGRGARYSASRALESLFSSDHIRNAEISRQAVQPLVEVVGTGAEREQHAAIAALVSLLSCNPSRNLAVADMDTSVVDVLARILSSDCSVDLKGDAAEFCSLIFGNPRIRLTVAAARCVEPLVSLLVCESIPAQHAIVRALDALLEDEQLAELVAAHGAVVPLVALLFGTSHALHDAVARVLVKLGKDRPSCKIDMVKAGVIDCALDILHEAPDHLASALADLLRILTNNASVARAPPAAKLVGPFFLLLSRPDLSPEGHHSVLQVLINVLENPKRRADQNITYDASVTPVLAFLDSPVPAVQQLAAELLSHLYSEDEDDQRHLQKHPSTHKIIPHLVRLLGPDNSGNALLQQRSATTLFSIAPTWPNVIAREGGVSELSRIILSDGASLLLWESAGSALASILQFSSEVYVEVPVAVLVRLLRAASETTVVGALNALLVLESDDGTSAESMAQSGAIDALVGLLGNHRCEDTASRLVEALVNNAKIRESKSARSAIVPLSQYLLDPNTQSAQPRLLATLALGDLFQNDGLARTTEALSACRALIGVLEDHPAMEEMTVVAVCALQNLVVHSRSNKRAVAEAGGVQVVLDLIGSPDPDTSLQSATLAKLLFSNHTIQEYASSETVRAVTAAIEKDLWASGNVHDEYLKALNALFGNFPRLRGSEPATLSIPHLVAALKTGSEATQEAALDALFFLRQAWSACSAQVSRAQSVAAADAIPLLQYLIQSGPPRFQEKSELLLQCLPGTLTVVVKRGNNMKQSVGNPSVYCKLILGTAAPRQTKVVSTGPNVEWDESFSWSFESPPKGQKLHISCKNKSKMARTSFGKVTIQIDRVVMLGVVAGEYTLQPESKAGPPRNLEIEFQWSNKNS